MSKKNSTTPSTWDGYIKDFIDGLSEVSPSYGANQIFRDVCRIMSLSLRGAVAKEKEKEEIETQYRQFADKYGKEGMGAVAKLFAIVVEALELRRTDFLGQVYERLNATVKNFGQYLTPIDVSRVMAKIMVPQVQGDDEIIKLNDCSCGAGVLLLEAAEAYLQHGGKQRNILICGEDLDETVCCIAYIQFSLLGYAAIITRQDTLAMKVIEGPWYTIGYFAHAFPMRLLGEGRDRNGSKTDETEGGGILGVGEDEGKMPSQTEKVIDVRRLVQGELF